MAEFIVSGKKYSTRRMNAFTQFHVARKLGPAVVPFMTAAKPLIAKYLEAKNSGLGEEDHFDSVAALAPMLEVLSGLPTEDVDFVLESCLSVVSRLQDGDGGWADVWHKNAKQLMFQDIDMPTMVMISGHVIKENLADFMRALPQFSSAAPQQG